MKSLLSVLFILCFSFQLFAQSDAMNGNTVTNRNPIVVVGDTMPPAGFPFPRAFNWVYTTQPNGMAAGTVGAMWFNGKYYFNRWNGTYVYRYNDNGPEGGPGTFVDSLTYVGSCRDMTTDGIFLYAGNASTTLYRFDPNTMATLKTFTLAGGAARAVVWDPSRKGFWNTNFGGNIFLHDTNGVLITQITSSLAGKYGLCFDSTAGDTAYLWVWNQELDNLHSSLHKINIQTGVTVASYLFTLPGSSIGIAGGAEIVQKGAQKLLLLNYQNYALQGWIMSSDAGPLAPFNLLNPATGTTITSMPGSNTQAVFDWDTSRANASYKWIFGSALPVRLLTLPVAKNKLTFTLGQLDNILASIGLNPGQSVSGQWDVWAFRGNLPPPGDSLKSTNGPRNITLARGVVAAAPVNLIGPPNNTTIVTSKFNPNPVVFNWSASPNAGNKYKMFFDYPTWLPPYAWVILTGFDTSFAIPNNALDGLLASWGVNPGDSISGVWRVYSYGSVDSAASNQTFNLTLKRAGQGVVLVAYDSTLTGARTSRDSVATILGKWGMTFDLFNRGGNTSTNTLSFKGYKYIVWIGEGTSVSSQVQRDSLRAWFNSGGVTVGTKSKFVLISEDMGYSMDRTGGGAYDSNFCRQYLGWQYLADRPASGAAQRLYNWNQSIHDSTIGSWPDVVQASAWDPWRSYPLYLFASLGYSLTDVSGMGKIGIRWNTASFGVDLESMRSAWDSPPGSCNERLLKRAWLFVDEILIPVELTSFTAEVSGNDISLNWKTATENNNRGFEIERKSEIGNFAKIGFVEGKGTTTEKQSYVFTDKGVNNGKYSYRLKQIDFDGTVSFSEVVQVDINVPVEFSLSQNYPNPFNPATSIDFGLAIDSKVTLLIYNSLGEQVGTLINNTMKAGKHKHNFDASKLGSGVYFYKIIASGIDGRQFSSIKKMILIK